MHHRRSAVALALALVLLGAASPAPAPIAGLQYLVGTWKCTYRAGTASLPYAATYVADLDGHALREITSFTGGVADEVLAYDAQHRSWSIVVVDGQGDVTVMRGTGGDPNHFAYRSVYPDASIADRFDRVSATEYTLHATVRSGSKTTASVDTCLRGAP